MKRPLLAFILPLAAILFVVIWGGGLGTGFILLHKTAAEEWGPIILGVALVVGVPVVASLLTQPRR